MMINISDFMRANKPVSWLIEGVLQKRAFSMLFGDPGIGKSFTALDFTLCIATGRPWLGRAVARGPVVYIASEGTDGLRSRIAAWCAHHGISDMSEIPFHLILGEDVALNDPESLGEEFTDALADVNPVLTIIDTMTGCAPGLDQNSGKEMAAFARACEWIMTVTTGSVLVIHHSGHKDKSRSKGAVDLLGAVDMAAGLSSVARTGGMVLRCQKSRNGKPFDDIHVSLQDVGPSAILVETSAPTGGEKNALTRGDKIFRKCIGAAPISEADARAAFDEEYGGSAGARRNAWSRARDKAVSADLIEYDPATGLISPCAQ